MPHPDDRPAPPQLAIRTSRTSAEAVTIHLLGELDLVTEQLLSEQLRTVLSTPETVHVTIDAAGLSFMDSSGLRVLLGLYRELDRRAGSVTVTSPQPLVRKVITVSGVHDRLRLTEEQESDAGPPPPG